MTCLTFSLWIICTEHVTTFSTLWCHTHICICPPQFLSFTHSWTNRQGCAWMKALNTGKLCEFKWTTSCSPRIVPEQLSGNSLSGHSRYVWLAFFCLNQTKISRNVQWTWMVIKTLKIHKHSKKLNILPLHYRAVPISALSVHFSWPLQHAFCTLQYNIMTAYGVLPVQPINK